MMDVRGTAGISPLGSPGVEKTPKAAGADFSESFSEALLRAQASVVGPQLQATRAVEQFSKGAEGNLHETLMAVDKAEISLKFFTSVRNRLVEAYREVMRMGG